MRRRARFDGETQKDFALYMEARINKASPPDDEIADEEIEDDRLRLIFTCCHPALPPEGQIALTLREICGRPRRRLPEPFSFRRQRLLNASCARRLPSAIRQFLIRCQPPRNYRPGWELSSWLYI